MVKKPSPAETETTGASEVKMTGPAAKRARLVQKEESKVDVQEVQDGNVTIGSPEDAKKNGTASKKKPAPKVKVNSRASVSMSTSLNTSRRSTATKTKLKIQPANDRGSGKLFTFGSNDCGQLGIECDKRKFPALVVDLEDIPMTQVSAGSLHTVALSAAGKVYTFGCNDESALGRVGIKDGSEGVPEEVDFPHKVVQVTAGDCHSALLTEHGQVFACGTFRTEDGTKYGLLPGEHPTIVTKPERVYPHPDNHAKIVKIASGINHLVMLSEDGVVYTCGDNELGQLGRVALQRSSRGRPATEPDNKDFLLTPSKVNIGKKVTDIWAGNKVTLFKTEPKGQIWACGLNKCRQIGAEMKNAREDVVPVPRRCKVLDGKEWKEFSCGKDHTIGLNTDGKVFVLGMGRDGQLGLVDDELPGGKLITAPTQVEKLTEQCVQVAAENCSTFAITNDLKIFGWGYGDTWQLGNGDDDDQNEPTLCLSSRNASGIDGKVTYVSAGFQHTAIIIAPAEPMEEDSD